MLSSFSFLDDPTYESRHIDDFQQRWTENDIAPFLLGDDQFGASLTHRL